MKVYSSLCMNIFLVLMLPYSVCAFAGSDLVNPTNPLNPLVPGRLSAPVGAVGHSADAVSCVPSVSEILKKLPRRHSLQDPSDHASAIPKDGIRPHDSFDRQMTDEVIAAVKSTTLAQSPGELTEIERLKFLYSALKDKNDAASLTQAKILHQRIVELSLKQK